MLRIGAPVLRRCCLLLGMLGLAACATVGSETDAQTTSEPPLADISQSGGSEDDVPLAALTIEDGPGDPVRDNPDQTSDTTPPTTPRTQPLPGEIVDVPVVGLRAAVEPIADEPVTEQPNPFSRLTGWSQADLGPALSAFRRSCQRLARQAPARLMISNNLAYGAVRDWRPVCDAAQRASHARPFFESLFVPVSFSTETGLLTGYYETEIDVRSQPDDVYSEPILRRPDDASTRRLTRAELSARSAPVIAYGKPVDVFFLHVQGSGRLHFPDGRSLRVGYAANNGHKYKSIGRVLIERGELTRAQSGKASIENWMAEAGADAARDLMNENPRYIFFQEQAIAPDEGPIGAMQVPLTAMGSVAIDPKYNPYGIPVWLDTRLPRTPRDHHGVRTGRLVITQDTGSAIRGPQRGDLFFGAGKDAGALAGVMKHPARWTILLPRALATRLSETSAAAQS